MALPFLRNDHKFIIWAIPVFLITLLLTVLAFERPGIGFVSGIEGVTLIGTTLFLVVCIIIQRISKEEHRIRNGLALLGGTIVAGFSIIFIPTSLISYLNLEISAIFILFFIKESLKSKIVKFTSILWWSAKSYKNCSNILIVFFEVLT